MESSPAMASVSPSMGVHLSHNLGKEHLCERHKEKLNLFCKDDQELLCLNCERSPEHRSHTVLFLEECFCPAKECKDQLYSCLEDLQKEQERILASKAGTEAESQLLLDQIKEKKMRIEANFKQEYQFLEEQKMFLLLQLEEIEKKVVTRREEHMAKFGQSLKELTSLEGLILQIEEKNQQSASELLQDIKRTLKRYEKEEFRNPMVFPLELARRIRKFPDRKPILDRVMNQSANVTLDPDTAHPLLNLSSIYCKSVGWRDEWQALPKNPERFDCWPCVLGHEVFTSGRHFWDVNVGSEGGWAVGVARKSVRRKGWFDLCPEEGIWAVGKFRGQYRVLNAPYYTPLSVWQDVRRIRVTLNCAERQVSFSNAYTGHHIYTHSGVFFHGTLLWGTTLLPFFCVDIKGHLSISL